MICGKTSSAEGSTPISSTIPFPAMCPCRTNQHILLTGITSLMAMLNRSDTLGITCKTAGGELQ